MIYDKNGVEKRKAFHPDFANKQKMQNSSKIILSIIILILCTGITHAARNVGSIDLSANPGIILSDGKSQCIVTAQVRDREGLSVPDGTEINFSASLGTIEDTAVTSAGVARVKLTSSEIPGKSVITATWIEGPAVSQMEVLFAETLVGVEGPDYVEIKADDYLAYNIDYEGKKTLEAIGNVRVRYRSLDMEARRIQIDLDTGHLIARGEGLSSPIKIKSAESEIKAEMFSFILGDTNGIIVSTELGGVRTINLITGNVEPLDPGVPYSPEIFDEIEIGESYILVKAREIVVFPHDKIQFKRAGIFLDGKFIISLPYHLLSLTGISPEGEEYVGLSNSGLTLNLPFYYALTPSSSGALLLRHGSSTGWGWYGQQPGWLIDVRQKYSTKKSQGTILFNQVTDENWGVSYNHSQALSDTSYANLYLDYPAHKDFFGSLSLTKSFKSINAGLNLYGSVPELGGNTYTSDLYLQTKSRQIGKTALRYTLSTRFTMINTTEDDLFRQNVGLNVTTVPLKLSPSVNLRCSAGVSQMFGDTNLKGLSKRGSAVIDWSLSEQNNIGITYSYSENATIYVTDPETGEETPLENTSGTQSLAVISKFANGRKWRINFYGIKGLDYPVLNVIGDAVYYLDDDWRLGVRATMNKFNDVSYNDVEYAVGRRIGKRELVAVWSQSEQKIALELGYSAF